MPRPNKIEIFVDENRMSPRWKKGCENLVKKESVRGRGSVSGVRKGDGESYRKDDRDGESK